MARFLRALKITGALLAVSIALFMLMLCLINLAGMWGIVAFAFAAVFGVVWMVSGDQ